MQHGVPSQNSFGARPSWLPESGLQFMQDANPACLLEAAVENHCDWFRRTTLAGGGEVVEEGSLLRTYLAPDKGESNIAFPRLSASEAASRVKLVMEESRRRRPLRIVRCWSLVPTQPTDLGALLFARGFGSGWQPHWMWLPLASMVADHSRLSGLQIEPVESVPDWDVQDLPYYDRKNAAHIFAAISAKPYRIWEFVARLDGCVVAHATLNLTTGPLGVAGIYNVGVIEAMRRQGIGTAVTGAACLFARELGCQHALLNATGLGESIYRRLGFVSLGFGQTWWWSDERINAPAPTPIQIAFAESLGRGDCGALEALASELSQEMLQALLPCGMTPLELAVETAQPAAAEWLIARGVPLDILAAWRLGWKERVSHLLAKSPQLVNTRRGQWQITLLHEAVQRNDPELACVLLSANADLSIQDNQFHSTPLGWARYLRRNEIAALIEATMGKK